MKKVLVTIVLLLTIGLLIIASIELFYKKEDSNEIILIGMQDIVSDTHEAVKEIIKNEQKLNITFEEKAMTINETKGTKEWFICYLEIIEQYDNPYRSDLHDFFTEEEIYLIERTIETECYDQDFMSRVNVANVILNRYWDGSFGKSIEEIITSPNQFFYGRTEITEDTKLALQYAFFIEDTTGGSIAFRSDCCPETWYKWEYSFTDDAGHSFYIKGEDNNE